MTASFSKCSRYLCSFSPMSNEVQTSSKVSVSTFLFFSLHMLFAQGFCLVSSILYPFSSPFPFSSFSFYPFPFGTIKWNLKCFCVASLLGISCTYSTCFMYPINFFVCRNNRKITSQNGFHLVCSFIINFVAISKLI